MSLLEKNPELKKNIWLEISTQRLIMMPLIILMVVLLASLSPVGDTYDKLTNISYFGMVVILLFWGSKVAYSNIIHEYNDRTWDWQRMSILTPKQLIVGKLIGAPIYNWYGAIICLLLVFIFGVMGEYSSLLDIIVNSISTLLLGISLLSVSILFALLKIREGNGRDKLKTGQIFILLILFCFFFNSSAFSFMFNRLSVSAKNFNTWKVFGENLFYAIWAIIGLHQVLRRELNYKNKSYLWVLFLITSSLVKTIVLMDSMSLIIDNYVFVYFVILSMQAISLFYLLLLIEQNEISSLKILLKKIKEKNYTYLNYNAPLWSLTFPFIVIGLITSWILFDKEIFNTNNFIIDTIFNNTKTGSPSYSIYHTLSIVLGILFFILRDFLIMLFLQTTSKKKRIGAAFILYLFLLYLVFPGFTTLIGSKSIGLQLFIPLPIIGSFFYPLFECVVLFIIIRNKFKK
jgi:hypothetical protein